MPCDWTLTLRADGAAVWTSPTGRTHTTHPGCRSFFPDADTTTAELPPPPGSQPPPSGGRRLKMPSRSRPRAAERAARIKAEREQSNSDPPPF